MEKKKINKKKIKTLNITLNKNNKKIKNSTYKSKKKILWKKK